MDPKNNKLTIKRVKIPKEMYAVTIPEYRGSNRYIVPIPDLNADEQDVMIFEVPGRKPELEDYFKDNKYIAISHPKCELSVVARWIFYSAFDNEALSFAFSARLLTRIRPTHTERVSDNVDKIIYEPSPDIIPTKEEYDSEEFQDRLFNFIAKSSEISFGRDITKHERSIIKENIRKNLSHITVGSFIDHIVSSFVPLLPYEEDIEYKLMGFLDELNVSRRLDKALILAKHCSWLYKTLTDHPQTQNPDEMKKSRKKRKEKPKDINRKNLVRKIIFGDKVEDHDSLRSRKNVNCIHINRSSKEDLMRLAGIGESRANQIVSKRISRPFTSVEDLTRINGISVDIIKKIKDQGLVCIDSELPNFKSLKVRGLSDLEDHLTDQVIGQSRAVSNLVKHLNLSSAGLLKEDKPLGIFMFLGPTGVGKTLTAESLSEFLFKREKEVGLRFKEQPFQKIDSGNFGGSMDFAVTKLVGSPPGYIGSKQDLKGGYQDPIFSKKNFPDNRITVLLLDEIEKAFVRGFGGTLSPGGLMRFLLPIFDKGKIKNNADETVNFQKSIIIMTSNIGAKEIVRTVSSGIGFNAEKERLSGKMTDKNIQRLNEEIFSLIEKKYKESFDPEFRNRVDRLIVFRFLTNNEYYKVAEKELTYFNIILGSDHGIQAVFDQSVIDWLVNTRVDATLGARSLIREIKDKTLDAVATYLNTDLISKGDVIKVISLDPLDKDMDPIFKIF